MSDLEQTVIARVFPRKTNASPTDALAFFSEPTIENISDCIKAGVTSVHMVVYVSERTAQEWHRQFIYLVAEKRGLYSKVCVREP